jgi:hypothetical protein
VSLIKPCKCRVFLGYSFKNENILNCDNIIGGCKYTLFYCGLIFGDIKSIFGLAKYLE